MDKDIFKLKNFMDVHPDFEITNARPKHLKELWQDAQKAILEELIKEKKYYETGNAIDVYNHLKNKLKEISKE